MLTRLRTTYQN